MSVDDGYRAALAGLRTALEFWHDPAHQRLVRFPPHHSRNDQLPSAG